MCKWATKAPSHRPPAPTVSSHSTTRAPCLNHSNNRTSSSNSQVVDRSKDEKKRSGNRRAASAGPSPRTSRIMNIDPLGNQRNAATYFEDEFEEDPEAGGGMMTGQRQSSVSSNYQFAPPIGSLAPRVSVPKVNSTNFLDNLRTSSGASQGSYYKNSQAAALYGGQYAGAGAAADGSSLEQQQQQQQQQLGGVQQIQMPRSSSVVSSNTVRGGGGVSSPPNSSQQPQKQVPPPPAAAAAPAPPASRDESSLAKEVVRLRHALILAQTKLQQHHIDIPKPHSGAQEMPHVKGMPIQPLHKGPNVGTGKLFEGFLEVLEGVDVASPLEVGGGSSLFGGPSWKRRFVVINEGGVSCYKTQEDATVYAGQRGLKGNLMLQHVSAFVPAFSTPGVESSKWTPEHPMAIDTNTYRYFGFVRDAGPLMTFRTDSTQEWNVWSHAMGRAVNPSLYAQTFPSVAATMAEEEAERKREEEETAALAKLAADKEEEEKKKHQKQKEDEEEQKRKDEENAKLIPRTPDDRKKQQQQEDATEDSSTPPPPPPPAAAAPPKKKPVADNGNDAEIIPGIFKVQQTQCDEIVMKPNSMQTDAWLPDAPIVDPVEVENQWATHVEQLHEKYGEHTAKLEHSLQLARAEVASLNSQIEILKQKCRNAGVDSYFDEIQEQHDKLMQQQQQQQGGFDGGIDDHFFAHHHRAAGDGDDSPGGRDGLAATRVPSLPRAEDRFSDQLSPISDSPRSPIFSQRGKVCRNCDRLTKDLRSVEEERDSLIRELARRHEDYQQGISRLCDQVLDDIDSVHLQMKKQQQLEHLNEASSAAAAATADGINNSGAAAAMSSSSADGVANASLVSAAAAAAALAAGEVPFVSIQLFDEGGRKKSASGSGAGRVAVRAAFDSSVCTLDSATTGRDVCTWTARDVKNGRSIASLRLKLDQ